MSAVEDDEDDFMRGVQQRQARTVEQRSRPRTVAEPAWQRVVEAARAMAAEDSWGEARPLHFVALHAVLFEAVYEFAPLDLTPQTRMTACGMVSALQKQVFGDDPSKVASYLKWVWQREEEREAWRRKNGRGGKVVGWRLIFGRNLLNEYALDVRRKSSKK